MHVCATTSDDLAFWIALPFYMAVSATLWRRWPLLREVLRSAIYWRDAFVVDQSEFWKIVEATKPEKLRALSDEEIRDCQNFFLETLDSTLPAYESVTASLRLILLRGEIDLRHSDARHRQTQRLARWAIGVGILSAAVILPQLLQSCLDSQTGRLPSMCPLLLQKLQKSQR